MWVPALGKTWAVRTRLPMRQVKGWFLCGFPGGLLRKRARGRPWDHTLLSLSDFLPLELFSQTRLQDATVFPVAWISGPQLLPFTLSCYFVALQDFPANHTPTTEILRTFKFQFLVPFFQPVLVNGSPDGFLALRFYFSERTSPTSPLVLKVLLGPSPGFDRLFPPGMLHFIHHGLKRAYYFLGLP